MFYVNNVLNAFTRFDELIEPQSSVPCASGRMSQCYIFVLGRAPTRAVRRFIMSTVGANILYVYFK